MATVTEIRHFERNFLISLLKAKETGDIDDLIITMKTQMEQEDVKIVDEYMTEWRDSKKK